MLHNSPQRPTAARYARARRVSCRSRYAEISPVMTASEGWLPPIVLKPGCPHQMESGKWARLGVSASGELVGVERGGEDAVLYDSQAVFGDGPSEAWLIRRESAEEMLLLGRHGSELLRLSPRSGACKSLAEVPRMPNGEDWMFRLHAYIRRSIMVISWELGVLAVGPALELLWRRDLDWNHELVSIDDEAVWFDRMYESKDGEQVFGKWGYALVTGDLSE